MTIFRLNSGSNTRCTVGRRRRLFRPVTTHVVSHHDDRFGFWAHPTDPETGNTHNGDTNHSPLSTPRLLNFVCDKVYCRSVGPVVGETETGVPLLLLLLFQRRTKNPNNTPIDSVMSTSRAIVVVEFFTVHGGHLEKIRDHVQTHYYRTYFETIHTKLVGSRTADEDGRDRRKMDTRGSEILSPLRLVWSVLLPS